MGKFREYTIKYNRKYITILVPSPMIEQLWLNTFMEPTYWDGNREAFKCLKDACEILGYKENIIIYFPLRKSKYVNYWYEDEHQDMILMNKSVCINAKNWKEIKVMIKKQKKIKYFDFKHNENKTISVFTYQVKKMKEKDYHYDKCPLEKKYQNLIIYRLPQYFFQSYYLQLNDYLKQNLEQEYLSYNAINEKYAYSNIWLNEYFYYKHKIIECAVELGFHDVSLANYKKSMKKRGE